MKKTIWTIVVIIVLLIVGYLIAATGDEAADNDTENSEVVTLVRRAQQAGLQVSEGSILVDLEEQDDSGVRGIAVLTEIADDRTTVAVSLEDEEGTSRPIHVHAGTCSNLGEVEYPLESVEDGFSNSTLSVTFENLEAGAPFAINAHESAENLENNIACGNIGFDVVADAAVIEGAAGGSDADDDDEEDAMDEDETDEEADDDTEGDTDDDDEADAEAAVITYTDAGFEPETLVVARGTTVRFENESSGTMWVASDVHPTHEILPAFDQLAAVATGADYEFTFNQEGTWNFHNHVSANHTGTVVVQ